MARRIVPGRNGGRETRTSREFQDTDQHGADEENSPSSGGAFPFINVDQSLKIDRSGRSTIRTQVMQDFYRKARQPTLYDRGSYESPPVKPAGGTGGQMKRFRLTPTKLQDMKKPRKQKAPFGKATNSPPQEPTSLALRGRHSDVKVESKSLTRWSTLNDGVETQKFPQGDYSDQSTGEDAAANAYDVMAAHDFIPDVLTSHNAASDGTEGPWYLPQLKILDYFGNALDPFNSLPGPNSQRKAMLIHHYFQHRLRASWLMIPIRKSWFIAAMQDLAWFYSALSHYAGTYTLTFREGDPAESLLLRTQSIEVVNERLGKPQQEVSDATIGAVASMIAYEANNGSLQALETHVMGLKRMINMRGGLEKANISQPVLRLIAWGDVIASCHMCRLAGLVPSREEVQDLEGCPFPNICAATRATTFNPFVISRNFSNLLGITRRLTTILHTNTENAITVNSSDHLGYSDLVYLVSRSLVFLCLDPKAKLAPIDQASCLALVLFVDTHLRDMTLYARITRINVPRLKVALQTAMEDTLSLLGTPANTQKLLWALFFGGIAAIAKPERGWFVARLSKLCEILGLRAWDDVEVILAGMLWEPSWEISPGLLWSEVQRQMSTEK